MARLVERRVRNRELLAILEPRALSESGKQELIESVFSLVSPFLDHGAIAKATKGSLLEDLESLPPCVKNGVYHLLARVHSIQWFQSHGDFGLIEPLMRTYCRRLGAFAKEEHHVRVSVWIARWQALHPSLVSESRLEDIVMKGVQKLESEDLSATAVQIGRCAWTSILEFSNQSTGWVLWERARSIAGKTAMSAAGSSFAADAAWNLASDVAWGVASGKAKSAARFAAWNVAADEAMDLACDAAWGATQSVAWSGAWSLSWSAAFQVVLDLLEGRANPYEPLLGLFELGFCPLRLVNGDYLVFIPDENAPLGSKPELILDDTFYPTRSQ